MTLTITPTKPMPTRIATVRQMAPFLPDPTLAAWDESPRLYRSKQEPWLLLPAEHDPMRTLKGQVAIPQRCLAELHRIADRGVEFDRLAVAHELDPKVVPGHLNPVLDGAGVRCTHEVARHLVGTITPPPVAGRRMAAALDKTVDALSRGSAAAAAAPFTASLGALDPIIFGVLGEAGPPAAGEPAYWFVLTAWRW